MKKIIALALAVICVFSLASCKDKDDGTLDSFKNAISATTLSSATVEVKQTSDFLPDAPLTANYDVAFAEDGTVTLDFEYTRYIEIGDGAGATTETLHGFSTIAPNGTVSGDSVSDDIVAAATVSFNLDSSKMTYSTSKNALVADIKAADTAAVLGVAVDCDVKLTLTVSNGAVVGATISYTKLVGDIEAQVEIKCTYNK